MTPLLRARLGRGWSQADLSAASGVSEPTIGRAERGERITLLPAAKLARALEEPPEALFPDLFPSPAEAAS